MLKYFAFLFSWVVFAQVTIRLTSLPNTTPIIPDLYFASSINAWNPADPSFKFAFNTSTGFYELNLPSGSGTVQYKITRGSWDREEANASGGVIPNRSFTYTGGPQLISISIPSWKDLHGSTTTWNTRILTESFFMPQLNRYRRIWLYLPPDYTTSTKTYPVIYMHDGQNLFNNRTAFSGEWQVDESLNQLHQNGDYGAIVVGIDNGGSERLNEYSPWNNPSYGGGQGDDYVDFIVQTLKPYIDANYRTRHQPEFTAIIGSSMGALISTYAMVKYPNIFGRLGSFSPAYWFALSQLQNYISNSTADLSAARAYHVAGQNESSTMVSNAVNIESLLRGKGLPASASMLKFDADGAHSEWYWRREFPAAYQFLFQHSTLGAEEFPIANEVFVTTRGEVLHRYSTPIRAHVFDYSGRLHLQTELAPHQPKLLTLPWGNYLLHYETPDFQTKTLKFRLP